MGKKFIVYGAGLIALYLVVANQTNFGSLVSGSSGGAANVIAAFQGRAANVSGSAG